MSNSIEAAQLTERVAALEKTVNPNRPIYTHGYSAAGRLVGVTGRTVRNKTEAGLFPKPCRIDTFATGKGDVRAKPIWRTDDLLKWAEAGIA